MSEQRYEYVAVDLMATPAKGQRKDDAITERINGVAAHGWRLTAVLPGGQYGGGYGLFERPLS